MNKRNPTGLVIVIICNIIAWPNAFIYFYRNTANTISLKSAWFIAGAAVICGICLLITLIQYFTDGAKRG